MNLKKIASVLALTLTAGMAQAANFSFVGNFEHDNDVQLFNFTVEAASTVTLRSWSYAGGVNSLNHVISRGGFDPILALFNSSGVRIGQQDDAQCGEVPEDVTGVCYDTNFSINLAAGSYTASVQQYDNFAGATLQEGFLYDGAQYKNFRNGFVDETNDKRQNFWAFDILNVNQAELPDPEPVPEPATLGMVGAGLALLVAARRRKAAK